MELSDKTAKNLQKIADDGDDRDRAMVDAILQAADGRGN